MKKVSKIEKKCLVLSMLLAVTLFSIVPISMVSAAPEAVVPRERTMIVDVDGRSKDPDPTNLNWFLPGGGVPGMSDILIEPLFIYNMENGSFMNWLGLGWEYSPDFTSIKVFLRSGVKWSDGKPFTADDVVFTYKMLLENSKLVQHGLVAEWVKDVVKIDDYTVEFQLTMADSRFHGKAAFPGIIYICGFLPIVPKHIWEKVDPTTFKNYPDPVFTGPYKLVSVTETTFIYDRNDDWWGTEVWGIRWAPERIIYQVHTTDEMAAMAAAAHELDVVSDITKSTFLSLRDKNPYVHAWRDEPPYAHYPHSCERYIEINKLGKYPFTLKEVRRALSYLTNRKEIVDVAYEGTSEVSKAIFGQTGAMQKWIKAIEDLLTKYEVTEHNPEKAYAIFESLGFTRGGDGVWVTPNGTRLEIAVLTPPWIEVKGYAMLFVEHLKEGGIDAVLKVMEATPWVEKVAVGDYEATALWLCPMGTHEPYTYLESYGHSRHWLPIGERVPGLHYNSGRFKNATYDQWVNVMGEHAETDPEYLEAFRKAYEIWLQEMPAIPLTLSRKLLSFDTFYWTGWPKATDNYITPFFWCGYGLRVPLQMKVRPTTVEYVTVYFTKEIRKFRGIDLNWYGPFKVGDAFRIPVDDAEFWIGKGSASYTPPTVGPVIPPEIPEMAEAIQTLVTDVGDLKTGMAGISGSMSGIQGELEALRGQTSMLATVAAVEGVAIIVLAALAVLLRRKPAE